MYISFYFLYRNEYTCNFTEQVCLRVLSKNTTASDTLLFPNYKSFHNSCIYINSHKPTKNNIQQTLETEIR